MPRFKDEVKISLPSTSPVSPQQPQKTATPPPSSPADIAPFVGGVGGMIAGGAVAGVPGAIIGGGGGQALGELIKEIINRHSIQPAEIARQGAEGALYGAIPGGEGMGIMARTLIRAATGAGIGAGVQAVKETGMQGTPAERAKRVGGQAAIGAATLPIAGAGIDVAGGALRTAGRFIGEKIPQDIYQQVITEPLKVASDLYQKVKDTLVGHFASDYFVQQGILPKEGAMTTEIINDSIKRTQTKAKEVETKLQEAFAASEAKVPYSRVRDLIEQARTNAPNMAQGNNLARRLYQKSGIAELPSTIGKTSRELMDKTGGVALGVFNDMKRIVGDVYHISGMPETYNRFQSIIENHSGVPAEVKALNQEAHKLTMGLTGLKHWRGDFTGTGVPQVLKEKLTPDGIQKAVSEAKIGNTKSLQAAYAALGILGLVGVMGGVKLATKSMTVTIGVGLSGLGLMFGLRSTIQKFLEAAGENPETKLKVANVLSHWYESATSAAEKLQLQKAIEQLSLRKVAPKSTAPTSQSQK